MADHPPPPPRPLLLQVEAAPAGVRLALAAATVDQQARQAIKGFQQLVREPWPLAEKLNKLTEQLTRACEPYNRKGDDRTLSVLTGAAAEVAEQAVRQAIKAIQADARRPAAQRDQRLQQLKQLVDGLAWLPRGYKSSLGLDIAAARARLKRHEA